MNKILYAFIALLVCGCFNGREFHGIDQYEAFVLDNDSAFNFLYKVVEKDTTCNHKYIVLDSFSYNRNIIKKNFKYVDEMKKLNIFEIYKNDYEIRFTLGDIGFKKNYNIWYSYRKSKLNDTLTATACILGVKENTYLILEKY